MRFGVDCTVGALEPVFDEPKVQRLSMWSQPSPGGWLLDPVCEGAALHWLRQVTRAASEGTLFTQGLSMRREMS